MAISEIPPFHVLLSGSNGLQRSTPRSDPLTPKTIHYKHSVRLISGSPCGHEDQIQILTSRFKQEISGKDQQIEQLRTIVSSKENDLRIRDEEMSKLHQTQVSLTKSMRFSEDSGMDLSKIKENLRNDLSFNIRKSSYLEVSFQQNQAENPLVTKAKTEIKSTIEALTNMSNRLEKPKRKYQFFNTYLEKEVQQHKAQLSKKAKQPSPQYNSSSLTLNKSFIQILSPEINNPSLDSSLDLTLEDDSSEVLFLQKIAEEHKQLRQTIIDLQQIARGQLEDMKTYYEGQIQIYISMLAQKRESDLKFHLNSTRTNIEQDNSEDADGRDEEEEEGDGFEQGKEDKFEIIFLDDEEELLSPGQSD